MRVPAKVLLSLTTIAIGFFLPARVNACSCIEFPPCEKFNHSTAVFMGKVLGGTSSEEKVVEGRRVSYEYGMVRFSIEETFKGVTSTQLEISWLGLCGYGGLTRGERYLVYAREDNSILYGSSCSTKPVRKSQEDISFLRNLPALGTGGRIYGTISAHTGTRDYPPMAGVKVVILNEHNDRIEVVTDNKGRYEITGLKPGKYIVEPEWPKHYVDGNSSYRYRMNEVEVSDRGCAQISFLAKPDSRLSGKVVDSMGRSVPAKIYLVSVDSPDQSFTGYEEAEGGFEIEGIPPGRYRLYVNLKDRFSRSEDEELYFYPGVSEKSKATIIEMGIGQGVNIESFYLPPKIKTHTLKGTVVYPDGRPAENVRVFMIKDEGSTSYQPIWSLPDAQTDAEGRFELQGFKGNTYKIAAQDNMTDRKPRFSEPLKITLDKDIENLRLVLSLTEPPENRRAPQKKAPEEKRQ
ncbi:MAG: hypothetical protein AB1631_08460 [Acidobacteriota bacterium]